MWIMSKAGAYSVVRKGKPGEYQVRGRERRDLQNLLMLVDMPADRLIVTRSGDYGFRLIVNETELGRIFAALMGTIDYTNFKDEVARHSDQAHKLRVYHEVWHLLSKLQPWPPYSGVRQRNENWYRDTFSQHPDTTGGTVGDVESPAPDVIRGKRGNGRKAKRDDQRPLDL
jgi:hypothetical protein